MPTSTPDPVPASVNTIRRRLISASPDAKKGPAEGDHDGAAVDFDAVSESGLLRDLQKPAKGPAPVGYDEVEALLQRYQTEKGIKSSEPAPSPAATVSTRRGSGVTDLRSLAAMVQSDATRPAPGRTSTLPPLTTTGNAELERLRAENGELRQLVAEYRELLEANDPSVWEQKVTHAEHIAAEREEQVKVMRQRVEEWDTKFKTHRFVPQDDELAQTADELDKERAKLAQESKQLETDRQQLKEDEEGMMKQMRDMEVGM